MPKFACAACNAASVPCAKCAAARKTPFDGLPIWPDPARGILPGARQMMSRGDDEDEDEQEEEGDDDKDKKKSSKGKSKGDDGDDEGGKKKKKKPAKGGGVGMPLILGIAAVAVLCCVCLPIGGGIAWVFLGGSQSVKDGPQGKDAPQAKAGTPADNGLQPKDGPQGKEGLLSRAARVRSINNLKQIGLAFHSFHDANKRLPFNGSDQQVGALKYSKAAAASSFSSGSWAFQVLPFLDQGPMFNTLDKSQGVAAYMCPGRGRPQMEAGRGAWTDYFINGYVNSPGDPARPDASDNKRTLVGITDGTSNTIFFGHGNIAIADYAKNANVTGSSNIFLGGTLGTMRSGKTGGSNPGGLVLAVDSAAAPGLSNWGGPFPQGGLMGMGDATVRVFPYSTANFGAFLTPTGNETVRLPDVPD